MTFLKKEEELQPLFTAEDIELMADGKFSPTKLEFVYGEGSCKKIIVRKYCFNKITPFPTKVKKLVSDSKYIEICPCYSIPRNVKEFVIFFEIKAENGKIVPINEFDIYLKNNNEIKLLTLDRIAKIENHVLDENHKNTKFRFECKNEKLLDTTITISVFIKSYIFYQPQPKT